MWSTRQSRFRFCFSPHQHSIKPIVSIGFQWFIQQKTEDVCTLSGWHLVQGLPHVAVQLSHTVVSVPQSRVIQHFSGQGPSDWWRDEPGSPQLHILNTIVCYIKLGLVLCIKHTLLIDTNANISNVCQLYDNRQTNYFKLSAFYKA